MRKLTTLVSIAGVILVLGAGPASAQKDPFAPLIDPNAPATTTDTTGSDTGGSPVVQPAPVQADALANTGTGISGWLTIAYSLLVLGGGALVIARMYQPQPLRRR